MKPIHSDQAPKAIGPYSQAIDTGSIVFCAGQTPIDPATGQLNGRDIETQTQQVFANITAVLRAAGLELKHVAKTTVFLKNFADFQRMNAVYAESFGEHRPARTTVEVSRLPMDCLVEIECIAVRSN